MEPSSIGASLNALAKVGAAVKGFRARRRPLVVSAERRIAAPWSLALEEMPSADTLSGHQRDEREVYEWLYVRGGVDFGETELRLDVHSRVEPAVSIVGLDVVTDRRVPSAQVLVRYPTAGAIARDVLLIDLDVAKPIAVAAHTDDTQQMVPVSDVPFFGSAVAHVTQQQPWSATIVARAKSWESSWSLVLHGIAGRQTFEVAIDDRGKPFRTVGMDHGRFTRYVDWGWYESPPRFVETTSDGLPLE